MRQHENFRIAQGEYQQVIFTVSEDSGTALDLTTCTSIDWVIWDVGEDAEVLRREKADGTISGAQSDIVEFELYSTETGQMDPGTYLHQLTVTLPGVVGTGEQTKVVAQGHIRVLDSVEVQGVG
jgi:hypothetical protein